MLEANFFRDMEPSLYEAIIRMKSSGSVDAIITDKKERDLWRKRLCAFTIRKDGSLMWSNVKVPTIEELYTVLNPLHMNETGKHLQEVASLRKGLSDAGFALPPFVGGLERAIML